MYSVLNLLIDPIALLVEMLFKLHICIDVSTYRTSTNAVCVLIDIAIHIKYV